MGRHLFRALMLAALIAAPIRSAAQPRSQPPSPGPGEYGQPEQQGGTPEQRQAGPLSKPTADPIMPRSAETSGTPVSKPERDAERGHCDSESPSDRHLVWLTAALVFVGGLQFGVYVAQARYMRRALAISDKAADAAKQSADALADIERPWITVETSEPYRIHHDEQDKRRLGIKFTIANPGRSPARIVSLRAGLESIPLPCPESLSPPSEDLNLQDRMMAAGSSREELRTCVILAEEREHQLQGKRALMLRVDIAYAGPLEREYPSKACWIFERKAGPGRGREDDIYGEDAWNTGTWKRYRGPASYMRNT